MALNQIEVEKKFRISKDDYDDLYTAKLKSLGFEYTGYEDTVSYYWPVNSGETFRICRITENGMNTHAFFLCTYKQKKSKNARQEFEERIPNFVAENFLLVSPPKHAMTRRRKKFQVSPFGDNLVVHVELDWVTAPEPLVGYYAEIEVMLQSDHYLFAAQALIDAYAEKVGFTKQETRSYFKLLKDALQPQPR